MSDNPTGTSPITITMMITMIIPSSLFRMGISQQFSYYKSLWKYVHSQGNYINTYEVVGK